MGDALSYNAYDYAGNNPVNNVDPSGMDEYTNPQMQGLIDAMAAEGAAEENLAENAAREAGAVPGISPVGGSADPVAKPTPEVTGGIQTVGVDSLPENAQSAYNSYSNNGWQGNFSGQTSGTRAGATYYNKNGLLPKTEPDGKSIT